MEFTIDRNTFLKSLDRANGIIETKTTLPILSNILIEAKDSKIKIVYNTKKHSSHYEVTPYTYRSDYSKKMYPKLSIDLGEGIVKMINEVKSTSSK